MSFVKDCVKCAVGYAAIIVGGYVGIAVGSGLCEPVCEAVKNKAEKVLCKSKSED
jgi:hypothetical protein